MGTVAILHIKRAENKSGKGKNGIGTQSVSNHPSGENTGGRGTERLRGSARECIHYLKSPWADIR